MDSIAAGGSDQVCQKELGDFSSVLVAARGAEKKMTQRPCVMAMFWNLEFGIWNLDFE